MLIELVLDVNLTKKKKKFIVHPRVGWVSGGGTRGSAGVVLFFEAL
jgi:hypothetical protein